MTTDSTNNIGAEETIISLVDNNKKLLEIQITPSIIERFIDLCKIQGRQRRLIQLLKAICSCHGEPIINNQNDIVKIMLDNESSRNTLMMPIKMHTDGKIHVLMDAD